MSRYSDEFLSALGAWQNGWGEKKERRLEITTRLKMALDRAELPSEAFHVPEVCYRKRFLVPNNPQNGGDFVPLVRDNELLDGVAAWTTDYDYAKKFKKSELGPRPGSVAVIFGWKPKQDEVVLNILRLWKCDGFEEAVRDYGARDGENAGALLHFRGRQSEIVLTSPLKLSETLAFCGVIPTLEHLCEKAGITTEEGQEELWGHLVKEDLLPFGEYWIEGESALRAAIKMIDAAERILEKLNILRMD